MLDEYLAEHLEDVSHIVITKVRSSLEFPVISKDTSSSPHFSVNSTLFKNTRELQSSLNNGTSLVVDSLSATTLPALRHLLRLLLVLSSLAHHRLQWTLHPRHSIPHRRCSALLLLTRVWTLRSLPTILARRTTKNLSLPLLLCLLTLQQIPSSSIISLLA